jgi:hypothetical protein
MSNPYEDLAKENGSKPEIKGGHKDANRSLEDKGKEPIYKDEDETKHKESVEEKTKGE